MTLKTNNKNMESLDGLLLSVVDETMMQVFTEAGTNVIYGYLENNSKLKQKEIAQKTKLFSAGLEMLLGSAVSDRAIDFRKFVLQV